MQLKSNYTIVIADDHPMILKGLYEELTTNGYTVVGQGTNGLEALELILKLQPTLAILDIEMPFLTGFEVVKTANSKKVDTKFIIQSFHKDSEYVMQAKSLQVKGYLLKEDAFDEIERCIKAVLNNKIYYSTSFEDNFLQNTNQELQLLKLLTPSETSILKQISQQITTNVIAESLNVSVRTIEKHRSNIIKKLNLKSEANSLTAWAIIHRNLILSL